VPSEYATSPIVSPADITADEAFHDFELNAEDGFVPGNVLENAENTHVDVTLDMENLHIGTSYDGIEESPVRQLDLIEEPEIEEYNGIPFDGTERLRIEMDIAQKPQSPPMSWAWGGLPQKSKNYPTKENLRKRQSTPVMSARSMSPELGALSVKEKVDSYLSTLPAMEQGRFIAIEQEQTEENLELMLFNEAEPTISCSLCGPLPEFQKLNAIVI
jgi:hypothetical protein